MGLLVGTFSNANNSGDFLEDEVGLAVTSQEQTLRDKATAMVNVEKDCDMSFVG